MTTATLAARRADEVLAAFPEQVVRRRVLIGWGVSGPEVDAHLAARRWRQWGQAVLLHAGPVTAEQRRSVALANVGGRALLTAFSSLAERGLTGWGRDAVHVLVPFGARLHVVPGLRVVRHRVADWDVAHADSDGRRHGVAGSAVLAAEVLAQPRPAIGLLAAVVQQRLELPESLRAAVELRPRHRHRRLVLAALGDIEMGAEALSEIDFAALCRSLRLPEPDRQAVRPDPRGRRRYLDVEWVLRGDRRVVVEIDGALHMQFEQYTEDAFRQNDIVLDRRSIVLRYSSTAVRTRDARLVDQLRRALR